MSLTTESAPRAHPPAVTDPWPIIERLMTGGAATAEQIAKVYELATMERRERARMSYNAALRRVQARMPQIVRDAENSQTRSRYALLETIGEKAEPIIREEGFAISYGTEDSPDEHKVRVSVLIMHEDGFERTVRLDLPVDMVGPKGQQNKTPTHGVASTISYCRRILQCMAFDIKTKAIADDDGNAAGGMVHEPQSGPAPVEERVSPDHVAHLEGLITKTHSKRDAVLKAARVERFEHITLAVYDALVKKLLNKLAEQTRLAEEADGPTHH